MGPHDPDLLQRDLGDADQEVADREDRLRVDRDGGVDQQVVRLRDRARDRTLDREHAGVDRQKGTASTTSANDGSGLGLGIGMEQGARRGAVCSFAAWIGDVHRARQASRSSASRSGVSPTPSTAGASAAPAIVSCDGPEAQARGDSSSDVDLAHPLHRGVREPERQLHPRPTSCSRRNSSETQVTSAPASSSPHGTPSFVALKIPESPRLDRVERSRSRDRGRRRTARAAPAARRKDLAAALEPPRPVREPAGRIVRAHDQPRPHDQSALAEHPLDLRLAERLERPVVGVVGRELVDRHLAQLGERALLCRRRWRSRRRPRCSRRRRSGPSRAAARRTRARSAGT